MNKIKISILSILLGMISVSCVDVLDGNVNPDKAHQTTLQEGLPTIVFYSQQAVYDHAEYYIYLSQCLTGENRAQIGSYSYKSEWEFLTMNRHPQWRRHFYDLGKNILNMIDIAKASDSPNYELIGRTIRLMSTQLTTDAFGDMPLSKAYLSNTPSYDTQASIYKWMLDEADALIELYENDSYINNPSSTLITKKHDRIYSGDLSKWKGLVYAVKARILLRNIPNVDVSPAKCQEIIDAANKAITQWRTGDLMYGAWFGNEPRYNFDGGTNEQNCVWSASQPVINTWESRKNMLDKAIVSKFFLVDCLGLLNSDNEVQSGRYVSRQGYANDPRASLLFLAQSGPSTPSNAAVVTKLRYLDNNIGMGISYKTSNYPKLYFGAYAGGVDAYNPLFTMEELYFIKAEAYYWQGDKTTACALAKEATEHNIERHLERFQKDYPSLKYPGNASASGPGAESERWWNSMVNNFLTSDSGEASNPSVTTKGNKRWFFNPSEFSLSDLMTQKYIAMYMQPEQWTDMRRYHYSNDRNNYGIGANNEIVYKSLRRPYNLYAPYWIDGLSEAEKENTWVQRINYDPETEEKYNRAELQRLGAYKNYKWLQKPMIWALPSGERTSLTAE